MKLIINTIIILLFCLCTNSCKKSGVEDIEGNWYRAVQIDKLVWMTENLKTTKFNDGSEIPLITDYDEWAKLTTPAYCLFNNEKSNKDKYGVLYNWYAISSNKLCPKGWHVATDDEWLDLVYAYGGLEDAGTRLKEAGYEHWKTSGIIATNESHFTALPGGYRSYNGTFNYLGVSGYWWTSTENARNTVYFYGLRYKSPNIYRNFAEKNNGFCVRCVLDQKLNPKK